MNTPSHTRPVPPADAGAPALDAAIREFDDFTRLAALICQCGGAAVCFKDDAAVRIVSQVGADDPTTADEVLTLSSATLSDAPSTVMVRSDDAGADTLAVRFFAGAPLLSPSGGVLGLLCAFDAVPRELAPEQKDALRALARQLVNEIELKKTAVELQQATQYLHTAQKMEALGRLAGGIAHDFNNILTAILGFSDVLLKQVSEGDPKKGELAEIRGAAERGSALTRQLLAFCRKQVQQSRPLDLNLLVGGLEKMLRELIPQSINLRVITDPNLGWVKADPPQLEQVVLNLALNARDAMPEGGRLTLVTSNVDLMRDREIPPGRYAMLAVCDTGVGMSRETISRIFEPFFTTKRRGSGTGLGLATVYGSVRQNNGYVRVDSQEGRGSTFQVYFPIVPAEAPVPAAPPPAEGRPVAPGSATILLVDDEPSVRLLSRTVLQREGYTVIEASNGREALKVHDAAGTRIDLLLTDLVMPEMGGMKLAQILSRKQPDLRIVFMSGRVETHYLDQDTVSRCAGMVEKPFRVSELSAAVAKAMTTGRLPGPGRGP